MLNDIKGLYQYAEARIPQIWCDTFYEYSKSEAIRIAQTSLNGRINKQVQEQQFLLIVPVVNWEVVLIDSFSDYGVCHHCNLESSAFFDTKNKWREYKLTNTTKIFDFFEEHYDETKINIVFLYISEFHINLEVIEHLKKKNTIVINFNWDDILHYSRVHNGQSVGLSNLAKMVDFNLTMSVSPMTRYVKDGSAIFYWQGMDSPDIFQPIISVAEVNKVLFFGARYGYRETLVDFLLKKNVPIDVYGNGWGTEYISYEDLYKKIKSYALNLGISTIGYTRSLCCFKGRDLEVPLHGGLYLVNDHPEITNMYVPEVDVLTYKNKLECYGTICKVLEDPNKYNRIKESGSKKAASLSWQSRSKYLVHLIKLIIGATNVD